jgi:signal transduction histidine kinase
MDLLRLRTLPGQLVALFVVVLLVSQVINVVLIIGERRLQARSTLYTSAVDAMAKETGRLLSNSDPRPRRDGPGRAPPQVHVEITSTPVVDRLSDSSCLDTYEERLRGLLIDNDISVETVLVCSGDRLRRPDHPPGPPGYPPPPRRGHADGEPDFGRLQPPHRRGPPPDPSGPRGPGFEHLVMSVQLADGRWINGISGHYPLENMTPRIFLATGGMILLTVLIVFFFARRITRPLTDLAGAADQLGRGGHGVELREEGPTDLRTAISAFNAMQERLTRMIETQRTMLRSVGHDLRTPLTSLRIRVEAMEPETERAKVIATLDEMKAMMEEILTWAEDASGIEELHRVDISAMLASLSDDYQDAGESVVFDDAGPIIVLCRRVSLRRALRNLIDNGLKYGGEVQLSLEVGGDGARICVDDNGRGIPERQLREVLKPFVRLETSRSKETGGAGLGLSIAQSIIQAHGAELSLENRKPSGLRASFTLPLEP